VGRTFRHNAPPHARKRASGPLRRPDRTLGRFGKGTTATPGCAHRELTFSDELCFRGGGIIVGEAGLRLFPLQALRPTLRVWDWMDGPRKEGSPGRAPLSPAETGDEAMLKERSAPIVELESLSSDMFAPLSEREASLVIGGAQVDVYDSYRLVGVLEVITIDGQSVTDDIYGIYQKFDTIYVIYV
jgi:hypothetical protein